MDKKAISRISLIFYTLIFLIIWALFIAQQLSVWGHAAVVNGSLTGIEAFFFENLNLIIGVIFFTALAAIAALGGD